MRSKSCCCYLTSAVLSFPHPLLSVGSCLVVWVASGDAVCSECRCRTQGRLTPLCMIYAFGVQMVCSWKKHKNLDSQHPPLPLRGSLACRGAGPPQPAPGRRISRSPGAGGAASVSDAVLIVPPCLPRRAAGTGLSTQLACWGC